MISDETVARLARLKQQHSQAAIELWNARLEILGETGDYRAIIDHLRSPVEMAGNNCSCNSGCGAEVSLIGQRK